MAGQRGGGRNCPAAASVSQRRRWKRRGKRFFSHGRKRRRMGENEGEGEKNKGKGGIFFPFSLFSFWENDSGEEKGGRRKKLQEEDDFFAIAERWMRNLAQGGCLKKGRGRKVSDFSSSSSANVVLPSSIERQCSCRQSVSPSLRNHYRSPLFPKHRKKIALAAEGETGRACGRWGGGEAGKKSEVGFLCFPPPLHSASIRNGSFWSSSS